MTSSPGSDSKEQKSSLAFGSDDHVETMNIEATKSGATEGIRTEPVVEHDDYPSDYLEGGLEAWLTLLGSFLFLFCTYG